MNVEVTYENKLARISGKKFAKSIADAAMLMRNMSHVQSIRMNIVCLIVDEFCWGPKTGWSSCSEHVPFIMNYTGDQIIYSIPIEALEELDAEMLNLEESP